MHLTSDLAAIAFPTSRWHCTGTLGGGEPPPGSVSWYQPRVVRMLLLNTTGRTEVSCASQAGVAPPPGVVHGQQPGAQDRGPAYVPMPPGPVSNIRRSFGTYI